MLRNAARKLEIAGATSETPMSEVRTEVNEIAPDDGVRRENMRNAVEAALAKHPASLIIILEYEDRVECSAVGTPSALPAVYHAGGDALAAMLRRALDPANRAG